MQERYLGDSHDFIKFALLRHLHGECRFRIGVNWYLTHPEDVDPAGSKDGEKRHHLKGGDWENLDSDLLKQIKRFEDPDKRRLQNIKRWKILPENTICFRRPVPVDKRASWHERAQTALKDADLVFLDPDNGFEVPSMKPANSPKYAFYREAADYLNSNKILVVIQFGARTYEGKGCTHKEQGCKIRNKIKTHCGLNFQFPIIIGNGIMFFTITPAGRTKELKKILESFVRRSPKVRGRQIIELIK